MRPGKRLQERDLQLVGLLGEARLLSSAQVRRAFFPGTTTKEMTRRLAWLSSEPEPLLRRVSWSYLRKEDYAWGLTPAGYALAETVLETELDVPRDDIGAQFLAHHMLLSEVLVGLLEARVKEALARVPASGSKQRAHPVFARARHPAFVWNVVGDRVMPWRDPNPMAQKDGERRLIPDAVLEFPAQRRRVFIESEMGTHTVAAVSESKTGATLAKAKRYNAFFTLFESPKTGRTFYQARYPDGYAPEVLFLVRPTKGDARERNVRHALAAWRKTADSTGGFRVGTVETALHEYLPLIGAHAPPASVAAAPALTAVAPSSAGTLGLTPEELRLLRNYATESRNLINKHRQAQRAQGVQDARLMPYAKGDDAVLALIERLRAARG